MPGWRNLQANLVRWAMSLRYVPLRPHHENLLARALGNHHHLIFASKGAMTPSDDVNDASLAEELRALIKLGESLPPVDLAESQNPGLLTLALGAAVLGREIAEGVLSEISADPPRGLNALRLARHLLELEHELHYAHAEPERRVPQFRRREAHTKVWLPRRYKGFKNAEADTNEQTQLTEMADEGARLDAAARARRDADEDVPASDWGTVPDRRIMAKALERTKEYRAHYDAASWLSHPSIGALENMLSVDSAGILHDRRSPLASALPGMALSLTRLTTRAFSVARSKFSAAMTEATR